jgi:hypothetical protein
MVRDERLRVVSSAAGSKGGGNPILKKREQPPPEIDQSPEATSKPTFKPTFKPSVAMASGYGSGCGFGNGLKGESEGETPPTVEEVISFGKSYRGNPDESTPGPIPEEFCKEYHEAKSTQRTWTNKHGVLVDWQREIAGKGWWRDQWATFGKQASKPKPAPDDWRNDPQDLAQFRYEQTRSRTADFMVQSPARAAKPCCGLTGHPETI